MRFRHLCSTAAVALFGICIAAPLAAGDKEAPQLLLVEWVYVHPEHAQDFEAAIKEIIVAADEHGLDDGWVGYSMDDLRYGFAFQVGTYAGMDSFFSMWAEFGEKWGKETFAAWAERMSATVDHFNWSLWRPRPDLSYRPDNAPKDFTYMFWGFCAIKPGHEAAVEESFKKFVALFSEHEVPHAWNAAMGDIGTDSPVLVYAEWGSSPGAFWSRADEINENEALKPGEALWQETLQHLRGYEFVTGQYREDLSYSPKKRAEGEEKRE